MSDDVIAQTIEGAEMVKIVTPFGHIWSEALPQWTQQNLSLVDKEYTQFLFSARGDLVRQPSQE